MSASICEPSQGAGWLWVKLNVTAGRMGWLRGAWARMTCGDCDERGWMGGKFD